jgi:hypothetical protein
LVWLVQVNCCTRGGRATPAAWNTRPQVPWASLRKLIFDTINPELLLF